MLPRPPGSTLTYTLFPYTPLFRSPNSGTFDEKRFVAPGPLPDIVEWRGVKLGLPICEDGWLPTVCGHLAAQGAELLISVNGSPYEIDKDERRLTQVFRSRVERSEEHTSELQSLMRNSYAVFCLKKKIRTKHHIQQRT